MPLDQLTPTQQGLPSSIFNANKSDYEATPLFFGQEPGLLDTVNKKHPRLFELYKTLRSLDWDEEEFGFASNYADFEACAESDRASYDFMIRTLAWQWEADSIASRSIATIMGPVTSDSTLWMAFAKWTENEVLHGLTYSEIVRYSFADPSKVLSEILEVKESLERLDTVAKVMKRAHEVSHKYALGQVEADQESYNAIFMFIVALYFLERIQFMASFSVTFALAKTGLFQSIGDAVGRIAQDEFEVHAQFAQEILRIELNTERGRLAYQQCRPMIVKLFKEIIATEDTWLEYLFSEGRELPGYTLNKAKAWVRFCGKVPAVFLDITSDLGGLEFPENNPIPFMGDYLDLGDVQQAPMEQAPTNYRVNIMARDDDAADFGFSL